MTAKPKRNHTALPKDDPFSNEDLLWQAYTSPKPKKKSPVRNGSVSAKSRKMRNKARKAYYASVCAISLLFSGLLVFLVVMAYGNYAEFHLMRAYLDRDTFYPGVCVDGIDLSGYTLTQAMDAFTSREVEAAQGKGLTFTAGEAFTELNASALGYGSNYAAVLQGAWQVGRSGSLHTRYANALSGCDYHVSRGYDEGSVRAAVDMLAQSLATPSVDASIEGFAFDQRTYSIAPEQSGTYVDREALFSRVQSALAAGKPTVSVEVLQSTPSVTAEDLACAYGMMSKAVTNASSSNANRISNIRLACEKINVCLQPGEEFSFNDIVGERTKKAGFKKAGVYISGELGEEIGGGICQVATTLFNAAVKADLEITERHNHSRSVSYVDNGKDATINWGSQDLKFVNTTDSPIYIVAYVTDDWRVDTRIYGKLRTDGITISVVPVLKETVSPSREDEYRLTDDLPSGEQRVKSKARDGYRVNTYKAYTDAQGNIVGKEFLCASYYPPRPRVIEVGR